MTLKLAVEITGSQKGLKTAAEETGRDLDKIVGKAKEAENELRRVEADLERAAAGAARLTNASVNAAGRINERLGVRTDFGSAQRGQDIAAFGSSLDAMRAKYAPVFAAQQTYIAQLKEIREFQRLGALSADEAAAAITRHKSAFAEQIRGQRAGGGAGGMSAGAIAARRQNVMAQNFDVFTSLAGGMNPGLVAIQQGPQYIQAYGGLKGTLDAIKTAATGTRLAMLGVTGVVVSGALAWDGYVRSAKAVETALAGVGRGAGATPARLAGLANDAASFGLTSSKVREFETMMLRAGNVGVEAFQPMLALARDFAATIGLGVDEGFQKLTEMTADPAKGAEQAKSANLIDGVTARQVQRLAEQNRIYEAQIVLLDAIQRRLVSADKAMTWPQRAVEAIGNFGKTQWDRIGRGADTIFNPDPSWNPRVRAGANRAAEDKAAQDQAAADRERDAKIGERSVDNARAVLDRSGTAEISRRREQLQNEIRALEERLKSGGAYDADAGKDAEMRRQEAVALDAKRGALAGLIPESERQANLDQIDIALMQARDPLTKAELERQRALIASRGEEITATERAARAASAYNRAIEEAFATAGTRVADLRAETAARAEANAAVAAGTLSLQEAEEQIRIETTLRPLIIAQANAEGAARDRLTQAIEAERAASASAAAEKARTSALRVTGGQRDELAQLLLEEQLIGSTNEVRARSIALLEAEQRIRDAGIASSSAEATVIRDNARALADRGQEVERLKAAYQDIATVGGSAIDEATRKLADGTGGWSEMVTGALDDVKQQIATWSIANPLKNALFGTNLPTMQDAGGAIGRLFGGQGSAEAKVAAAVQSTATMTVTAGVVNIAGGAGVGSLIGSAGGALPTAGAGVVMKAGVPQIPGTTADGIYLPKNIGLTSGAASAASSSASWLSYVNQGSTRNQPLDPRLVQDFAFLKDRGYGMQVFSGGQSDVHSAATKGLPGGWTGSTRHDNGMAADVFFTQNGRRLDYNIPADREALQGIVAQAKANGVTGFGAGPGYMDKSGVGGMHVGYGDPGVWGAGGKGANAPQWLRDAYGNPAAAPAAPTVAAPELRTAPVQQGLDKLTETTNQAATGAMPALTAQTQAAATGLDGFGQRLANALTGSGSASGTGLGGGFFSKLFGQSSTAAATSAPAVAAAPQARALTAAPLVQAPKVQPLASSAAMPALRVVNPPGRPQGAEVQESRSATGEREFTVILSEMAAGEIDRGGSALEKSMGQRYGTKPQTWSRGA